MNDLLSGLGTTPTADPNQWSAQEVYANSPDLTGEAQAADTTQYNTTDWTDPSAGSLEASSADYTQAQDPNAQATAQAGTEEEAKEEPEGETVKSINDALRSLFR
jgi:hypothetical protein